jgi:large subunit ribosomal protein L7/L12
LIYVKEVVFGEEAAKDPGRKPDEAKVALVLVEAGEKKIEVIKLVREITGLGLKEAKELVDGAPQTLKPGLSRAEALELQKQLEAAGAKARIEP